MYIRPATLADLPAMVDVLVDVMLVNNDPLFVFLAPGRVQYPGDFRHWFLSTTRARFYSPDNYTFVAETDENDQEWNGQPRVVAHATWSRIGNTKGAKRWTGDSMANSKFARSCLHAFMA